MGLDITAYRKIEKMVEYENRLRDDHFYLVVNSDYPQQADGLIRGFYSCNSNPFDLEVGSYLGYKLFREKLAKLIGTSCRKIWKNPVPGPFVELINFADNDGTIGPVTSKKLYKDFLDYIPKVQDATGTGFFGNQDDDEFFISLYQGFMYAFEIASDGGCVVFH